jgi:thiol-disulfide isomerase/thioredoxin
MKRTPLFLLLMLVAIVSTACDTFGRTASNSTPATAVVQESAPAVANLPEWMSLPLVNGRTGETFTFAQFVNNGTPVYVEPFATWCSNCRRQLGSVNAAAQQLGERAVFVVVSVETELTAADMKAYADRNNFDLIFAVATPELLSAWVSAFGRTVTNPPSTPFFVIRADGTTTPLGTGFKSADDVIKSLQG